MHIIYYVIAIFVSIGTLSLNPLWAKPATKVADSLLRQTVIFEEPETVLAREARARGLPPLKDLLESYLKELAFSEPGGVRLVVERLPVLHGWATVALASPDLTPGILDAMVKRLARPQHRTLRARLIEATNKHTRLFFKFYRGLDPRRRELGPWRAYVVRNGSVHDLRRSQRQRHIDRQVSPLSANSATIASHR